MSDGLFQANDNPMFQQRFFGAKDDMTGDNAKWKIVIADDEEDVHIMTKMVLRKFEYDGRKLQFISAYSAKEAITIMAQNPDTAILLLDIIMEADNSGLEVVKAVRGELSNPFVRIILRTGQPGQAPEETVIREYDINDYKSRIELTVQKLNTSIIAALRAFKDIKTIEASRLGLANIIQFTRSLFSEKTIAGYTQVALDKIVELLNTNADMAPYSASGFFCMITGDDSELLSSVGGYENHIGLSMTLTEPHAFILAHKSDLECNDFYFENDKLLARFCVNKRVELILFLEGNRTLSEFDKYMIQTFSSNLSIGLENLSLNDEIINTQREVIFTLGEIVETRSKETANHVRRVAEFSYILGIAAGLAEEEANLLRLASPMHDIGKIGIPDQILNKPGKLTPEEFEVIKGHSKIGYDILKPSDREIMKAAAIIAHEHHERWDGTGYPNGLSGNAIHLFARITSVIDVFDALGHKRVYKEAWSDEEILAYMREQSGRMFDSALIDCFFKNLEHLNAIKEQYPD